MLEAVFYARFHPERGPSVIHQHPKHSILSTREKPLLAWHDVSSYIIPPYDLCNQPLSICTNGLRILGFPVSLENAKYSRNRFTFNVCFVLDENENATPWEQVVRKTANFFTAMEIEDELLQKEEELHGLEWADADRYPAEEVGTVCGLLKAMAEDLNTYGETCARVDDVHVLNLRLEAQREPPPKVNAYDVPLLIRNLPDPVEWTWDLTLQRIHPHLDGIKHVHKISELADVELKLVKRAVKELVYHGQALLLDIFHFQAIYASTDTIVILVEDEELQEECQMYVAMPPTNTDGQPVVDASTPTLPAREDLVELYCLLQPGIQLADFCLTYKNRLVNIDIRRFITFGVIKGFLRRIHKFAFATGPQATFPALEKTRSRGSLSKPRSSEDAVKEFDRAWRKAALTSGWATPPSAPPASLGKSFKSADRVRSEEDDRLQELLDGNHRMDEICVAMHLSEKKVVEKLKSKKFGMVVLFNK